VTVHPAGTGHARSKRLRVAVATSFARKAGGTEHYLDAVIPDLARDHDIALWCDEEGPRERDRIAATLDIPRWTASDIGLEPAVASLIAWRPDIVYVHALTSPASEERLLDVAPNILFPHDYRGTCISGHKLWKTPRPKPCARPLGPACLLHFYPHRCGGLNPMKMVADYRDGRRRTALLPRYHAVLTTSAHMREEMIRNGAHPGRSFTPPYVALGAHDLGDLSGATADRPAPPRARPGAGRLDRLIFVGRMDSLKGGRFLLRALPLASRILGRPLHLTMAGDGLKRAEWEKESAGLATGSPGVTVEFRGWLRARELASAFDVVDLLVVPSVWPEPFGIVGPQAGSAGLPAAAFRVGGIPEWLSDGVNGHMALGDPPSPEGLANAIVQCVADPGHYARLSAGAVELSQRFDVQRHAAVLRQIFTEIAASEPPSAAGSGVDSTASGEARSP
jgi:glycosyltransferase involved in cell wall biosynthesis